MTNKLYIPMALLCLLALILGVNMAAAQVEFPQLVTNAPQEAEIVTPESELIWQFFALQNDVYSIRVDGVEDFDPVVIVRDVNSDEIIRNDDYNYPDSRDALLEAITIPRTGDYLVAVTGYEGMVGAFTLTLLPGYGRLALDADMGAGTDWRVNNPLTVDTSNDTLTLGLEGVQVRDAAPNSVGGVFADFYAEVNFVAVQGRDGWTTGLALRLQSGERYYAAEVNALGAWRFVLVEGESLTVIRDWTQHPAIVAGQTAFQLGVLAMGDGFDVFYNGQFVGQVRDDTLTDPGQIGLTLLTANAFASRVTISADELLVTEPVQVNGERVFPMRIIDSTSGQIVRELERRGVIPTGGQQPLNVSESFIERRTEGADTFTLGRGATFNTYVMATTVSLRIVDSGLVGCGLLLRQTDATEYVVAFVDNGGGYGISERNGEEAFSNGLYNEDPALVLNESNRLLVIVDEGLMHYYVNALYMGNLPVATVEGEVGTVILNYSGVDATCEFSDTWLWRW